MVVQDLTQTLTKDITKRMCETLGFYLLDKWWAEQEQKYKEKHSNVPSMKSSSTSSSKPSESKEDSKLPKITRVEDISSFFDKQRESMETGTGLKAGLSGFSGLGFRGSIPKMPSFKKKVTADPSSKTAKKIDDPKDRGSDKKKKISDKRREQEKRREERLKKDETTKSKAEKPEKSEKSDESKKESKKTLSSIYSTLYSDTDESKDTELSDIEAKKSPKIEAEKKFKKKRSSPKPQTSKKKRGSSVSSISESSSSSEQESSEPETESSASVKNQKSVKKVRKIQIQTFAPKY